VADSKRAHAGARPHFGARSIATAHEVWEIRRRWARRPRWTGPIGRRIGRLLKRIDPFIGAGSLTEIGYAFVFLAFIVFMIYVGVPALLWLLDAVYAALLIFVALIAHMVLGRPWTIEATRYVAVDAEPEETLTWQVQGWRTSLVALDQAASMLSRGQRPQRLPIPTPFR